MVEMQEIFEMEMSSKLKKLPKPIGYERALLLAQRNHKDSPGPSKEDTEKSAKSLSLADSESWTPWSDDRIERAVAEVFNVKRAADFWMSFSNNQVENEMTTVLSHKQTVNSTAEEMNRESTDSTSPDRSEISDDISTTSILASFENTILTETEAATAVVSSQSGITQTTATASIACESEQTEQSAVLSSAPADQIVANVAANNTEKFIWNLDAPPFVPHNLINNLSCPILNGIRTSDAPLPILSAPIVESVDRRSLTLTDQVIQSRPPSIVHAKPSRSRNFPFVRRNRDDTMMPAYYSGQFQQVGFF
ncbi:unnamed protein product [Wuchereria bancrofti]|uniref:Uncharacterized protein n=1 Tax=Wuchereria bancrofti TaxID=6293 RepID=A0A3P7GKT6_WUCBA|nr:unnamed protein product [Wuchereria bancrofti]